MTTFNLSSSKFSKFQRMTLNSKTKRDAYSNRFTRLNSKVRLATVSKRASAERFQCPLKGLESTVGANQILERSNKGQPLLKFKFNRTLIIRLSITLTKANLNTGPRISIKVSPTQSALLESMALRASRGLTSSV